MPRLEGMYAPGNECAHLLPPAGFSLPFTPDVFRFNRALPFYPPDPCIRPNEGDMICPPEYPPCPKTRYPPSKPGRHFDYRYPSGATECNSATHRHGHVPRNCTVAYPGADELVCLDKPRLSDCEICGNRECVCGGQGDRMHNTRDNILQSQGYSSCDPSYNLPKGMSNNRNLSSASMYNNTSTRSIPGADCGGCFHHYGDRRGNSGSYIPDRNSTILPVHGGDNNGAPCPQCTHSYFQTSNVCRPMFDRTFMLDCPEQDGPPANTYTFL